MLGRWRHSYWSRARAGGWYGFARRDLTGLAKAAALVGLLAMGCGRTSLHSSPGEVGLGEVGPGEDSPGEVGSPPPPFIVSLIFPSPAFAGERRRDRGDRGDDMNRDMEDQSREQRRQARDAEREADRQARQQQRNQERADHARARESQREQRQHQNSTHEQAPQPPERQRATTNETGVSTQPATAPQPSSTQGSGRVRSDRSDHDGAHQGGHHGDQGGSGTRPVGNSTGGTSAPVPAPAAASGENGTTASTAASSGASVSPPPATVEQWLKAIGTPQTAAPAPVKPVSAKPFVAKAVAPKPRPAKPAAAAAGASVNLEFPELAGPEVLAVNATAKTIAQAKKLGFVTNGVTTFSELGYSVTRLQVPSSMSAASAGALLNTAAPQANVTVNQKYRIYRPATGRDAGPQVAPASNAGPGGAVSCGIDHCFGRDIVGWKPALRSCVTQALRIGVIDTSVDVKHPAFVRKKIEVQHLGHNGAAGPDWHGTGVTALLAGDTSSGTPGLIPDASFYVAGVFYADSDGQPASDTLSMLRAFDWLDAKNVKIINMSLSGPPDALIEQAIKKLSAKGILFVAAAGNEGPAAGPSYPAAYDQVIAVTAVGQNLKSYRYANRGSYIDISAPGVAIWTAMPGAKEGYHSGTSFATPYVTAALAAIYQQLPVNSPADVLKHLSYRDLGAPGPDPIYGQGLLVAPASCNPGGQIAGAQTKPAANQASSASGVISANPIRAKPSPPSESREQLPEQLPWISQGTSN